MSTEGSQAWEVSMSLESPGLARAVCAGLFLGGHSHWDPLP